MSWSSTFSFPMLNIHYWSKVKIQDVHSFHNKPPTAVRSNRTHCFTPPVAEGIFSAALGPREADWPLRCRRREGAWTDLYALLFHICFNYSINNGTRFTSSRGLGFSRRLIWFQYQIFCFYKQIITDIRSTRPVGSCSFHLPFYGVCGAG